MLKRVLLFLVVVTVLVSLIAYSQYRPPLNKVSGFLEAHEIRLGSRVGGRVARVHVQEGDPVQKDQVLIDLEPFDLLALEREAEAKLAAHEADYRRLKTGLRAEEKAQAQARYDRLKARVDLLDHGPRPQEVKVAEGNLDVARSDLKLARQNHARVVDLAQRGVAAQEELDRVTERQQAAEATVRVREQERELLEPDVWARAEEKAEARAQMEETAQAWELAKQGFREEEIAAAEAARDAAQAALAALRERKQELQIRAPVDGVIEALALRPGDLTAPGAPVLSLQDTHELWVRAYVPETRLDLQRGQSVWVTVDSYPRDRFAAQVTFISRQAEFTPSNIQTPDERVKQVFRIKVTLKAGDGKLKPGMSADVWLDGP